MNGLQLDQVCIEYGVGDSRLVAVAGVDLIVARGSTTGIIGESGSGKSTIAKAIVGLVPVVAGSILVDDVDVTNVSGDRLNRLRDDVQLVFQDPYSSLNPRMNAWRILSEALSIRPAESGTDIHAEALALLEQVGLGAQHLEAFPHQLSGGQRQRLAIARALARRPQILILDEVTSALDVSVQAAILNLLRELQRKFGLTYLLISHDLSVARYMSNRIAVMYLGRIVEIGAAHDVLTAPSHPYTKSLIDAVPRLDPTFGPERVRLSGDIPDPMHPPTGCRFHTRCPVGPMARLERRICLESEPELQPIVVDHRAACHFPLTAAIGAAPKSQASAKTFDPQSISGGRKRTAGVSAPPHWSGDR